MRALLVVAVVSGAAGGAVIAANVRRDRLGQPRVHGAGVVGALLLGVAFWSACGAAYAASGH